MAHEKNLDLNTCPTCRQPRIEVAPGVWTWAESTYKLHGKEYKCDCAWQDDLRRHYLLADIPTDYWALSTDDFFGDSEALKATQEYLAKWDDWKSHGIGLEFYSVTQGTGKTMLASLIMKDLIQRGERAWFIHFRDAIRTYDMPFERREETVRRLRNTPVLVLDEVTPAFTSAQGDFFAAELEDLIRFRTGGNGVTIITTNMTPKALDQAYPRTFSLLASKSRKIQVFGTDARRDGDVDLMRMELILNHEARPIT